MTDVIVNLNQQRKNSIILPKDKRGQLLALYSGQYWTLQVKMSHTQLGNLVDGIRSTVGSVNLRRRHRNSLIALQLQEERVKLSERCIRFRCGVLCC